MLKQKIIMLVRGSNKIKAKICMETDRSMRTIDMWLEDNHPMLTTARVLSIISQELNIPKEDLLEKEKAK